MAGAVSAVEAVGAAVANLVVGDKKEAEAEVAEDDHAEWAECDTFSLRPSLHPSYFPGRRADIVLQRLAPAGSSVKPDPIVVGTFGILHPDVLSQFQIPYVCSAVEINIEHFL